MMKDDRGEQKKRGIGSVLRMIFICAGALILFAVFYVITVVLAGQDLTACAPGDREITGMTEKIGERSFSDLNAMRYALGAAVPVAADQAITGMRAWDDTYAGAPVWRARIDYGNGAVMNIVRPVPAAPLLQISGLKLDAAQTYSVCNLEARLCEGRDGCCLYFADENAAYALYMPGDREILCSFAGGMIY